MPRVLDNNIIQHDNDTQLESYKLVEPKMPMQEQRVLQCIKFNSGINHPHAVSEHTGIPLRSIARAFSDLEDKCEIIRMTKLDKQGNTINDTVYWKETNRRVLQYRIATDAEKLKYRQNQLSIFDKGK